MDESGGEKPEDNQEQVSPTEGQVEKEAAEPEDVVPVEAEAEEGSPPAEGKKEDAFNKISSIDDIDDVLEEFEPGFSESLSSISSDDFKSLEIDSNLTEKVDTAGGKAPHPLITLFKNLPIQSQYVTYAVAAAAIVGSLFTLLVFTEVLSFKKYKNPYVVSMRDLTDNVYDYDVEASKVPLFDDFRTKAHTITIGPTVINLKSEDESSSLGRFEFFINIRDKELAQKVKAKENDIIQLINGVLERVTWAELQSPIGKEKVKKVIRGRINNFFQANIVIGVYYRSVILRK